jgi:hypothetical protein
MILSFSVCEVNATVAQRHPILTTKIRGSLDPRIWNQSGLTQWPYLNSQAYAEQQTPIVYKELVFLQAQICLDGFCNNCWNYSCCGRIGGLAIR